MTDWSHPNFLVIPPDPRWSHHLPAATVLPSRLLFARPSLRCFWSTLRPALWSADCSSNCPVSVFLDSLSLTIPPPFLIVTVPCASLIIADPSSGPHLRRGGSIIPCTWLSLSGICIRTFYNNLWALIHKYINTINCFLVLGMKRQACAINHNKSLVIR